MRTTTKPRIPVSELRKPAKSKTPALDALQPLLAARCPRITASMPGQELWDIWKDYEEPDVIRKQWNFQLMVIVDSFLGPLSKRYDHIRDLGFPMLASIFSKHPLPAGDLTFVFPDRWLTPRYAMLFNHSLNVHPSICNGPRRKVLVVCFQPYIVGDCRKEQVRIMSDDEEKVDGQINLKSVWGIPEHMW